MYNIQGVPMFTEDDFEIDVQMYYRIRNIRGKRRMVIFEDEDKGREEYSKDLDGDDKVFVLNTKWRQLTWGESNDILKRSINKGTQGVPEYDNVGHRMMVVEKCLVKWDRKDASGNDIPVNRDTIYKTPGVVIEHLFKKYEEYSSLSGDEEKK